MDSSTWSEAKKTNAANRFVNRLQQLWESASYRAEARRSKVAIDLSIALAESKLSRQAVANKAGMKLPQLSRQLSGEVNLTLDSIGKICEAIGYDFDMVLRKAKDKAALQPWQQRMDRTVIVQQVNEQRFIPKLYSSREIFLVPTGNKTDFAAANESPKYRSNTKFDTSEAFADQRMAA
jgi:transcriptional regulator with XRE-family HTH domain